MINDRFCLVFIFFRNMLIFNFYQIRITLPKRLTFVNLEVEFDDKGQEQKRNQHQQDM